MTEYRSVLERAGVSAPPPDLPLERVLQRRDRKRRNQRIQAGVLGIAIAILAGWWGIHTITSTQPKPANDRSEKLGIFAPVAGRIVYSNKFGIWAVDPDGPADPSATVQLTSDDATPMGWSRDGTRLLILRDYESLFVLDADGSETQVTRDPMVIGSAAISPDGSRVVFAGKPEDDAAPYALYAVAADGGAVEKLVESRNGVVRTPTFSPDGTRIAYADDNSDIDHSVWVMNADGSDAHPILPVGSFPKAAHVSGLAWSPTGDRIALGFDGIYTFAPDGSDFTQVITGGEAPSWSPDGSRIAYTLGWPFTQTDRGALGIADADGSNDRSFGFAASGPWHPAPLPADEPPPDASAPEPRRQGEFLVLASMGTGLGPDIAAEDPATTDRRKLVETDGIVECPNPTDCAQSVRRAEWSSDGRWVAFQVSSDPGGPCAPTDGVWVQGPAGDPWQLTAPCTATPGAQGIEELWAWSPAGARLAYARVGGENRLYVIDPTDGSRTLRLQGGGDRTALAWTPDGTRIAVASEGEGIYVVEAEPGGMTRLGESFENVTGIDYSPDGTQVMVLDQGGRRLEVMNAYRGLDHHSIVEGQDFCCAAWSPSGDRILYQLSVENGTEWPDLQVWTVAPDGSNPIEVFDDGGCALNAYNPAVPVWAPNGTQVAVKNCDTWVVENADGTGGQHVIGEPQYRIWSDGDLVEYGVS